MSEPPKGGELFIVDNSNSAWKGLRYLQDWTEIASSFDIATGFFEIGSLLALDGKWQKLDNIRILMGDQATARTRAAILECLRKHVCQKLDASLEAEKETNDMLAGTAAIVDAMRQGKIQCRVYANRKFHAKAYITHPRVAVIGSVALVGSSNFTVPGLTENVELNIQVKAPGDVAQLQQWFEQHWQEAEEIGEFISRQIAAAGWGKNTVSDLSVFIRARRPGISGFSASNLWRMRQFHDTYAGQAKLAALLRELNWTQNLLILARAKRPEEREFYLRLCAREKWPSRELERQLKGALFERTLLTPAKLAPVVRQIHPAAAAIFKDTYLLDFLDLPEVHSEADLQGALVANLKEFLLELGRDFSFVGEQYLLQVGGKDFRLDLLFYHRQLQCLVAFDLKIDEFQPEYLGKMEFYLEALDRDVRKPHERPSIGVLLCATKDNEVVEYALARSLSPALIAEYQTALPDKQLLRRKLHEFYQLALPRAAPAPGKRRKSPKP